ncbi:LysR family transcriptional regulator [bacterium]|jgi:DNA-binding transcriptional LysR family regulator|nr:LysR family transcriptional regulator [bacterium]
MFNLNDVKSFIAVVENGSFKGAADALHKAQPVITYQVKQLEAYLGYDLFDRSQYRARLTGEGKSFFPKACLLIEHVQELESSRLNSKETVEGHISLSVSSLYPKEKLNEIFGMIQQQFPDTSLTISIDTLVGIKSVLEKKVDIVVTEKSDPNVALINEETHTVKLLLASASNHPLAMEKKVDTKDLLRFPQIVLKSSGMSDVDDEGILRHVKQWFVSSIDIKRALIINGLGWGYLPEHMIKDDIKNGKIVGIESKTMKNVSVTLEKIRYKKTTVGPVESALYNAL